MIVTRFHRVSFCAGICALAGTLVAVSGQLTGCSSPQQPRTLVIAFSNDMLGEIRSCGCVAEDFGGLGRRATYINQLRGGSGNVLLLDGGDLFGQEINYGMEKADLTLKSMGLMGYDGIVLGEIDFVFGAGFVTRRVRELRVPVVVANLYDARTDSLLFPPSRVVKKGNGIRIGLIGVMDPDIRFPPQVPRGTLRTSKPVDAVRREIAALGDDVDLVVVLAHMQRKEAQELAVAVPEIDLIVHGHRGRSMRHTKKFGNAYVLQVADRGRYMGSAVATLDNKGQIVELTANVVPLDKHLDDDEGIDKLFQSYDLNIAEKEKSGIPPGVFAARKGLKKPFAGSDACADCHEEIHTHWLETKHAHAMEILISLSREYDRDCTPCHTTGFYKRGGFENYAVTPDLVNVGCEACHGNGHDHVADPDTPPDSDAKGVCRDCHNADQSPEFEFRTYWERIRHPGENG